MYLLKNPFYKAMSLVGLILIAVIGTALYFATTSKVFTIKGLALINNTEVYDGKTGITWYRCQSHSTIDKNGHCYPSTKPAASQYTPTKDNALEQNIDYTSPDYDSEGVWRYASAGQILALRNCANNEEMIDAALKAKAGERAKLALAVLLAFCEPPAVDGKPADWGAAAKAGYSVIDLTMFPMPKAGEEYEPPKLFMSREHCLSIDGSTVGCRTRDVDSRVSLVAQRSLYGANIKPIPTSQYGNFQHNGFMLVKLPKGYHKTKYAMLDNLTSDYDYMKSANSGANIIFGRYIQGKTDSEIRTNYQGAMREILK